MHYPDSMAPAVFPGWTLRLFTYIQIPQYTDFRDLANNDGGSALHSYRFFAIWTDYFTCGFQSVVNSFIQGLFGVESFQNDIAFKWSHKSFYNEIFRSSLQWLF